MICMQQEQIRVRIQKRSKSKRTRPKPDRQLWNESDERELTAKAHHQWR